MLKFLPIYAFEHRSKKLPIMLNIMPITTAIMPQFSCSLITVSQNFYKDCFKIPSYASIMLNSFGDLLCSNYAGIIGLGLADRPYMKGVHVKENSNIMKRLEQELVNLDSGLAYCHILINI